MNVDMNVFASVRLVFVKIIVYIIYVLVYRMICLAFHPENDQCYMHTNCMFTTQNYHSSSYYYIFIMDWTWE